MNTETCVHEHVSQVGDLYVCISCHIVLPYWQAPKKFLSFTHIENFYTKGKKVLA